jgi:hypothetical protein
MKVTRKLRATGDPENPYEPVEDVAIEIHDAVHALELLGKVRAMFAEKHLHGDIDGRPIRFTFAIGKLRGDAENPPSLESSKVEIVVPEPTSQAVLPAQAPETPK